jgi:hypothetical protein
VVVRDRNAHAWVELWMPSQGWVKFDPTPRSDGINPTTGAELPFSASEHLAAAQAETRPRTIPGDTATPTPTTVPVDPDLVAGGEAEPVEPAGLPGWLVPALVTAVLLGLVPGIKWLRRRQRIKRLDEGDVAPAWQEIVDRLADLKVDLRASETPAEVAADVGPVLAPLADVYSEAAYGPGDPISRRRLATAARSLTDTEDELAREHTIVERVVARYRVRSMMRKVRR